MAIAIQLVACFSTPWMTSVAKAAPGAARSAASAA